ncbi:MAG: SWIM zinc finger family protein [Acidiferrobacteraceae bacterium]
MTTLVQLITETSLRALAGDKSFARGVEYFESGAVGALVETGDSLKARVSGTQEHEVSLAANGRGIDYVCTCPVGEDGDFCKHAVAAGLAWLAQRTGAPAVPTFTGKPEFDALRGYLAGQSKEQLVDLLLQQAENDSALCSRLSAQAALKQTPTDIQALKDTVRKSFAVRGFVDYYGVRNLVQRAVPIVELPAGLIQDGHAVQAVELAGYAMRRGLAVYENSDDSSGALGDLLREIAELHLKACRAAPPPSPILAGSFFAFRLDDQWDFFAFGDYAPLLGEDGLKTYRALAQKAWEKVPARGTQADPGKDNLPSYSEHFTITRIMEELAERDGDTDAIVAIMSRDLSHPYHFLQIAKRLEAAGRCDEALSWAERGRKTFPDRSDSRLTDFLADEYSRRGRHEEAIGLTWERFQQQPALASYQCLKTCTKRAGTWNDWRTKALAWLHEGFLNAGKHDRRRGVWMSRDHSLLVEIFLWEGDSDAALAEAKTGSCGESLWFSVAEAREAKHPEDAVAIYHARLDGIVKQANKRAYDQAAALVAKIRTLMQRAKQEEEFAAWLDTVRLKHKAKRNFMQRLDRFVQ